MSQKDPIQEAGVVGRIRAAKAHTQIFFVFLTAFAICLVLAFPLGSDGWTIGATINGFLSVVAGLLWLIAEMARAGIKAGNKRLSSRPRKPLITTSSTGERFAHARPSIPFRGMALLAAVFVVRQMTSDPLIYAAPGLPIFAATLRIMFFMDARATCDALRIRGFFRTVTFPKAEVIAIHGGENHRVIGPRYQPFALHLSHDERFADAATELLELDGQLVNQKAVQLAIGYDKVRGWAQLGVLRMAQIPVLSIYLGSFATLLTFFPTADTPTHPAWVLPVAITAVAVGSWLMVRNVRRYKKVGDWTPYAELVNAYIEKQASTASTA